MAKKFSKQSMEEFTKAARRFNQLRGRYLAQKIDVDYVPEKVNVEKEFEKHYTTEELRAATKRLLDYKSTKDFELISKDGLEITQGEANTYARLAKAAKARQTKNIKGIRAQMATASTERITELNLELQKAEVPLYSFDKVVSRKQYDYLTSHFERESFSLDRRAVDHTRYQFINSLAQWDTILDINTDKLRDYLAAMSANDFKRWWVNQQSVGEIVISPKELQKVLAVDKDLGKDSIAKLNRTLAKENNGKMPQEDLEEQLDVHYDVKG